ncbi:MAG: hypothetical protein LBQ54_07715 [Planctomycetaceae bacterium]|nr:hypothetical protein [Planctomycetaceae bacterium]
MSPAAETLPNRSPQTLETYRPLLNHPILFVKRHNYLGLHIYDTFYKWRPGGGIYVLENPADPPEQHRIRAVIDAHTPETLGEGVYSDPDLSWDASRILFCFKASRHSGTSIYEIGLDGTGLRRLTESDKTFCNTYCGVGGGHHDVMPAYLPDGRIVFTSTRYGGLVPCANNGVNILHVMNADGSGIHPISVNNVNEFDPSVMPDGRILFGRWEYIDKTALTQQSMWTVFPDGTNETAMFANNMVFPEATLQPRTVPGSPFLVCCTFTPHNSPPRGSIAMVDLRKGKDEVAAITNFEHPDKPTFDRGESCDPWPLSENLVLYSGLPGKNARNSLMLIDRDGNRSVLLADAEIDLHNPIVTVPRTAPPVLVDQTDPSQKSGNFFVYDIYKGMPEVPRGSIRKLRVVEETSRVTPSPGPGVLNQTFLVSAALAFSSKNVLGVVPVAEDGSVYFNVPSGKAVYFQALDAEGRLVRSMRTFIQAAPGTTRSCVGCHEYTTPTANADNISFDSLKRDPDRLTPESWGSGPVDYPSMVQPVLDRHCVRCHGGTEGIEAGLDLTGGWTENFNNSYENLVSRREVIYTAPLIGGIDCMNGTANWSAQILGPYSHGSGKAPLADVVISGHENRFPEMTPAERDTILAWMDSNGVYYGTWNYTKDGYTLPAWQRLKSELVMVMREAGCAKCHADEKGNITRFEADWFNLERPELSRILRAPLAPDGTGGHGLGFCRNAKIDSNRQRLRMVTTAKYEHAVKPLESFPRQTWRAWDKSGEPVVSFSSTDDPVYQKILGRIQAARTEVLTHPRIDMPGAVTISGQFRQILPTPVPDGSLDFHAAVESDGVVKLAWERSAKTYGLTFQLYRDNGELITETTAFESYDLAAEPGVHRYTLVVSNGGTTKKLQPPLLVNVPKTVPLPQVKAVSAVSLAGEVILSWKPAAAEVPVLYAVYRRENSTEDWQKLTESPIAAVTFNDTKGEEQKTYEYCVAAVSRRGDLGGYSAPVIAASLPEPHDVLFETSLQNRADAKLSGGSLMEGQLSGNAQIHEGTLELSEGQLTFPNRNEYNLARKITVDFYVKIDEKTQMPILVSFGRWNEAGWFVQWLGDKWRWHLAGVDCDGGTPETDRWIRLTCHYDGKAMRILQDGKPVAEKPVTGLRNVPWKGDLVLGNYSGGFSPSYQLKGNIKEVRITNDARIP